DHRLAAVQAVLLGPPFLRERRQLAAEIDQVLVALGPVAEERELLGDRGLRLRGAGLEGERRVAHPRFQRTPCGVSSSTMPSAASCARIASARAKSRACLAAARSSTSAWMRASSPSATPRENHAAGACCSRPRARPAPSSSPFSRTFSPASDALR